MEGTLNGSGGSRAYKAETMRFGDLIVSEDKRGAQYASTARLSIEFIGERHSKQTHSISSSAVNQAEDV